MVQTNNITYQYPDSNPIFFPDLRVDSGHALLICGESGCGKTTLLHLLAGLRQTTSGQIIIERNKISDLPSSQMD
jgi:putative ABC transport system ATP-binding protein